MKWSLELITELNEVVSYLRKNNIGKILENLANYFIKKHDDISNYSMNFTAEVTDISMIGDGEYRLAYICEIIHLKTGKIKNVYGCLSHMIKYCLKKRFKYSVGKPDNKTSYLISLLKDTLKTDNTKSINFGIKTVKKLIGNDIDLLTSCVSASQNIDLSILSPLANRSILEILKTRRTLYVRILLLLTYEIREISDISKWVMKKLTFSNRDEMIISLTSPCIETIIFLTSLTINIY